MNFLKVVDREGSEFVFLLGRFLRMSMEKLKAGIFDGPQMREFMKDLMFNEALGEAEQSA